MKYNCELIRDIMPIYIDGALSDKSKEIVEEHLGECQECTHLYQAMTKPKDTRNSEVVLQNETRAYAKKIKKTRLAVASFIGILIIGMASMVVSIVSGKYETFVVKMGSYVEAKDYIERGWIPEEIPEDAQDISVIYNIDSNNVNGQFRTSKEGAKSLIDRYEVATVKDLSKTDKPLNDKFKKVKDELVSSSENVTFLQNDTYIFAIQEDGTVFYFAK